MREEGYTDSGCLHKGACTRTLLSMIYITAKHDFYHVSELNSKQ